MEELDAFGSILLELKRKIDEQQKTIDRINLEKVSLIDKYDFLSKKIEELASSQKSYEKKYDDFNRTVNNLENSINTLNLNIDKKLDHQKVSQQQKLDALEKKLNVGRLEEISRDLDSQMKEYSRLLDSLNNRYSNLKVELEPKVEEIVRKSVDKLLKNISIHENRLKDIERLIKEIKESKELKEKVSLIAEHLNQLNKQIESLEKYDSDRANNLKLSLIGQKRHISSLDKELTEFKNSIEYSKKYSERLNKYINELSEKIKELKEETKIFEDRIENNIKKDEGFLQDEIDKLSKLFINTSARVEELSKIEGYLEELKKENKSIHNTIDKDKEMTKKIIDENISLLKKELEKDNDKTKNEIQKIVVELKDIHKYIHDVVNKEKELTKNLIAENANRIHERIETESKKTEEKLNLIKEKYSENAKKVARQEVVPIITQVSREQENIKQKLKQMELSFNIQVKASSNFYDILKHEVNEIRNEVLDIREGLTQNKDYTFMLKNNLLKLENSLEKAFKSVDSSKQDYIDRFKKQKSDIDVLAKDLLHTEKRLNENMNILRKELEKKGDRARDNILKIIDDVKKEKEVRELRRIEKLNEILKEFSDRRSQLEERINVLSEHMNRFLEIRGKLRKDIVHEVMRIVKTVESRQKYHEKKILLEDEDIKDIKAELDKLEKSLSDISKEVAVWKEKYKLQLGRLADEVEI